MGWIAGQGLNREVDDSKQSARGECKREDKGAVL